jgi:hypothetical protein
MIRRLDHNSFPELNDIVIRISFATEVLDYIYIYENNNIDEAFRSNCKNDKIVFKSKSWSEIADKLKTLDNMNIVYHLIIPSVSLNFRFFYGKAIPEEYNLQANLRIETLSDPKIPDYLCVDINRKVLFFQWLEQDHNQIFLRNDSDLVNDLKSDLKKILDNRNVIKYPNVPDKWTTDYWINNNCEFVLFDKKTIMDIKIGEVPDELQVIAKFIKDIAKPIYMSSHTKDLVKQMYTELLIDQVIPLYQFDISNYIIPDFADKVADFRRLSCISAIKNLYENYTTLSMSDRKDPFLKHQHSHYWYDQMKNIYEIKINNYLYGNRPEIKEYLKSNLCNRSLIEISNGIGHKDILLLWGLTKDFLMNYDHLKQKSVITAVNTIKAQIMPVNVKQDLGKTLRKITNFLWTSVDDPQEKSNKEYASCTETETVGSNNSIDSSSMNKKTKTDLMEVEE